MTDTIDLARRGALKALSMATAMVAGPGKALAEAAVAAASMPAAAPMVAAVGRPRSDVPTPLAFADDYLGEMQWGSLGHIRIDRDGINYDIACFRSASPAVKAMWERQSRREIEERNRVYEVARRMLHEGKIPL